MVKKLGYVLILVAALSFFLAAVISRYDSPYHSILVLNLPFDLIGIGLRKLSLSSSAGNAVSILLYILLSLSPFIYYVIRMIKHKLTRGDIILPILCCYNFYMIYEFINPQLMMHRVINLMADEAILPVIKLSFSIIFFTLLFTYLIFKMMNHLSDITTEDRISILCSNLSKILILLSVLYTFYFSYFVTSELVQDLKKFVTEDRNPINLYYPIINYSLEALPVIFTILTLLAGINLLRVMVTDHMKEAEYLSAQKMCAISKQAVYVTVLSNILTNVLQFFLSKQLNNTDFNLNLSLTPLIIAFLAMILSGYFEETKELYDDNSMII